MTPAGTFDRVYTAIKEKLRRGMLKPGERLEPAALSDELFASVTPIRDALHRLVGERLVEAPRQEGFRVPMLSETRLRHLYAWHRDLLLLALMRKRAVIPSDWDIGAPDRPLLTAHEQRRAMFAAIARSTGNPEHLLALEAVSDRLEPMERLEDLLLGEAEFEAAEISAALHSGDRRSLRRSLLRYHRRRARIIPELLEKAQLC